MIQPKTTITETQDVKWAGKPCPHLHVIEASRGGEHFSQGEPWDDISTYLFCLDCLQVIEVEAEVEEVEDGDDAPPPF